MNLNNHTNYTMKNKLIKLWNKLFKLYVPKPEEFEIKVVPSWHSMNYVNFKYRASPRHRWKYIYHCKSPFLGLLEYDYTWEKVSFELGQGIFDAELNRWGSIEKIEAYEKAESEKYYKGVQSHKMQRQQVQENKQKAYERANKK